jgi:hypothetical protein
MPDHPYLPADAPPQPPVAPEPDECCNSGCVPCIYDLYDEALAQYRLELAAWQVRQASPRRE